MLSPSSGGSTPIKFDIGSNFDVSDPQCSTTAAGEITAKFNVINQDLDNLELIAVTDSGHPCTVDAQVATLQVSGAVITATCTSNSDLADGAYAIKLDATSSDKCTNSDPVTAAATVTQTLTSASSSVDVSASTNTAVCPGAASLTYRFTYTGNNVLNLPVQLRATLPGAACSVSPAEALTGSRSNVVITARCNLVSGQSFPAGTYSATLVASLAGPALSDTATGTVTVTCGAAGCSALQACGGGVVPVIPDASFALQCPKLPSQVALGDTLVLVFPVAATGNVAATSLTLTDKLGAGLEFVVALVDNDASACSYSNADRAITCSLGTVAPGAPAKAVWIMVGVVANPAIHTYSLSGTTASNGPVSQTPKACAVPVLTPDVAVSQAVNPAAATLSPGNQPVFTFTSTVGAAAGSGRVNGAQLRINLSAELARTGDIVAQPDGICTAGSTSFTCTWGQVVEGSPKTVVYQAFAFASGSQFSAALVSATGDTQTTGNNAQTTTINVQAPSATGLFTSISAPSPIRTNANLNFTVAAGVAAGGSSVKPLRLVIQAVNQPSTLYADISGPSTRVPVNEPFKMRLRGGMTVSGDVGLRLVGSAADGCGVQLQNPNPAAPICSILPSLADISCAWGDTSGTNALREAQLAVLSTRAGNCTFTVVALAAGKSSAESITVTTYLPTCNSFLPDGTPWADAPGNACPAGASPIAATGVVKPGPTSCCIASLGTADLQVSVTLPPPGHRREFQQFLFVVNASYPAGPGPAVAKQVLLEDTLPALLTPLSTVVVGGSTATCVIRGQQLTCAIRKTSREMQASGRWRQ
ncbi:hypothetical protein COO60DRAFT_1638986 [Scenedesmus sp. NREL 46B-D3]|nr:hypothetical protein COO60DRAFT_1638986 [Scenedesmus sp. NREL 46B-D3]